MANHIMINLHNIVRIVLHLTSRNDIWDIGGLSTCCSQFHFQRRSKALWIDHINSNEDLQETSKARFRSSERISTIQICLTLTRREVLKAYCSNGLKMVSMCWSTPVYYAMLSTIFYHLLISVVYHWYIMYHYVVVNQFWRCCAWASAVSPVGWAGALVSGGLGLRAGGVDETGPPERGQRKSISRDK